MSIGKFFEELETAIFSPIERAAEAVVNFERKEVHMLTEEFNKVIDAIKAALGRASDNKGADAQTIKDLQSKNSALTTQLSDAVAQRDGAVTQAQSLQSQLTDTQQQLSDAKDQLDSLLNLAEQIAPDPAATPAQ